MCMPFKHKWKEISQERFDKFWSFNKTVFVHIYVIKLKCERCGDVKMKQYRVD